MTVKETVFDILRSRRWITSVTIEDTAGPSGLRRLRELRSEGYEIKSRRGEDGFEYRLTSSKPKATA